MKNLILLFFLIIFSLTGCWGQKQYLDFDITPASKPAYLKDGKTIILSPIVKNKYRLILYNMVDQNITVITSPSLEEDELNAPALSYDGKRIAFTRINKKQSNFEICIINIDGTGYKQITNANHYSQEPFFSPDGQTIYFIRALKQKKRSGFWLYSINVDGTNEKQISDGYYAIINPACTPDGKYIIFSQYYEKVKYGSLNMRIVKLEIETGKTSIVFDNKRGIAPIPMFNKNKIIYIGYNLSEEEAEKEASLRNYEKIFGGIWSINLDGTNKQFLTKTYWTIYYLSISFDDKKLLFLNINHIMEYDIETTQLKEIIIDKDEILSMF